MTGMAPVAFSLAKRELTRFIRQPQRVVGTVAQPLLFWLFLGAGFGGSFRPAGMENVTYLEYFYPGVMLMMMLFASIFSSITIIEDRDAGFLQGVLVAPVSRLANKFLDAIETGTQTAPDFKAGYRVQRLIDAAQRSNRLGHWIDFAAEAGKQER